MQLTDKLVRMIEDDPYDADLFKQLLESTGELHVEHVPVYPSMNDYAGLVADDQTGAMIIDERLAELSGANYTGLELATFLRTLRPELPIYILTAYTRTIPVDEGESVESVLDKPTVQEAYKVAIARILRAMQRYEEALTQHQRRLRELIDRRLAGQLDEGEENELQQLRADIERPFATAEIEQELRWKEELQRREDRLQRLEKLAEEIKGAIGKTED